MSDEMYRATETFLDRTFSRKGAGAPHGVGRDAAMDALVAEAERLREALTRLHAAASYYLDHAHPGEDLWSHEDYRAHHEIALALRGAGVALGAQGGASNDE